MRRRVWNCPRLRNRARYAGQRNRNPAPAAGNRPTANPPTANCDQSRGRELMRASKMFVILSEVRRGGRSRRTCFSLVAKQLSAPLLVLALTTTLRAQQPSTSPDDAKKDPILSAMLAELDRSKQHLQLEGFEKPYYIEYRLDDEIEYEATAAWGALVSDHEAHRRIVRVTARVGDYKLDSSGERGDASLQVAATENDPMAL